MVSATRSSSQARPLWFRVRRRCGAHDQHVGIQGASESQGLNTATPPVNRGKASPIFSAWGTSVSAQPVGIGERVAQRRKLHGLTQVQLAHRAHVSLSLLRKVEQGSAPASPAFTAAVATALRTTVAELYDQPSLPDGAERDHVAEV